jgi:hypothetical protein
MSFNITLGNLADHIQGPANPSALSELIKAEGTGPNKFTVHGAKPGQVLDVAMDLPYTKSYGINQTQKGGGTPTQHGVEFSFVDQNGSSLGPVVHDQMMAMLTKAAAGSLVVHFKATFLAAGDYTFTGNKG